MHQFIILLLNLNFNIFAEDIFLDQKFKTCFDNAEKVTAESVCKKRSFTKNSDKSCPDLDEFRSQEGLLELKFQTQNDCYIEYYNRQWLSIKKLCEKNSSPNTANLDAVTGFFSGLKLKNRTLRDEKNQKFQQIFHAAKEQCRSNSTTVHQDAGSKPSPISPSKDQTPGKNAKSK